MELLELIIRFIAWLAEDKTKSKRPPRVDPAAMAEWQRRREAWEAQQRQTWANALHGLPTYAAPAIQAAAQTAPPAVAPTAAPPRAAPAVAPRRPASPPAAVAESIARWARPRTLRSQFILTEVLKPPLSLRDVPGAMGLRDR